MKTKNNRKFILLGLRIGVYFAGIMILAFGITLNTKTGLGVSPIISIPYNASKLCQLNLGTLTFLFYCLLVLFQIFLLGKQFKIYQLLQFVMSLLTSVFIGIFDRLFRQLFIPPGRSFVLFLPLFSQDLAHT